MLGKILIVVLAVLGLYLLGGAIHRKIRCTAFVMGTVVVGVGQRALQDNADRKNKFPQYGFSVCGKSVVVLDYNVKKSANPQAGDMVRIFCDPEKPDKLWYTEGSLLQDVLYGVGALVGAACVGALYLI